MEEAYLILERHEEQLKTLKRDVSGLREVQAEIRAMNETLVTLASELKHTNDHLERHERKIEELNNQPRLRLQQIITAIIAAVAGGAISIIISAVT